MTPEEVARLREKHYNATVVGLRKPNEELMLLRVRPDHPLQPHKPGQYTSLGLGYWEPRDPEAAHEMLAPGDEQRLVRRAYSMSCPVLNDAGGFWDPGQGWLEFYIVLVRESGKEKPPGLTPRLFMLREGARLNMVEKITGNFTLDPVKPGDTVVFLSTGTGEAPHNYMLWELLRRGHTGRILAACCVRFRRDLGYLPLHQELMRSHSNYTYLSLATREPDTINQKVYIQDLITSGQLEEKLGLSLDPARTHVYLCGNPKMIGAPDKDRTTGQLIYPKPPGVVGILEERGFRADNPQAKESGNIHFEKYW